MNKTFLEYVAEDIIGKYGTDLSRIAVVFPNKRAALFLNEHLARIAGQPVWSPAYITISDLFRQHTDLKPADPIKLICDIHKSFTKCTGIDETLDHFYGWGQLLLADFDDIDKNMADADSIFCNLKDIHELDDISYLDDEQKEMLKRFFANFSDDIDSELKKRFLSLWPHFGDIYHDYNRRLTEQGLGYEGAIYRKVASEESLQMKYDKYLFVGFNLLQKVERVLFSRLMKEGKAKFYWDFDEYYMPSPSHHLNTSGGAVVSTAPTNLNTSPSQHLSGGALVSSAPTNLTTSTSQHLTTSPSHHLTTSTSQHLTFTYGEIDTTKEKKKAEEPNIFTPHVENILLPMKTYASNVEFKQSNKSRDFINDEADDEQAEQQSYIKTGLLLHYLFSNIETADDIDSCLHDMEMEGLFDESVITPNKLKNMLHKRFSNPKVKEWFGGGWTLFNECSILSYDPHTDKLTEHRPDRVMKRGDEVQIVDFKFGKPQPEHTDQVRRYISLTHDMGYTDVKGYLWYVYSDNIVEV